MKRFVAPALVAVNALMLAALVWMWFTPSGALKNTHWTPVRGQKANLEGVVPHLGTPEAMDQSQFLAMLDRPLFSLSRRPPPPPPPPEAEVPPPAPDHLSQAVLSGVYASEDGKMAGVIIKFDGKDKSVPLRGSLDGWTLSSVVANRAVFTRGDQTRELMLEKAKLQTGGANPAFTALGASPATAAAQRARRPAAQQQPKPPSGPSLGGSKSLQRP